MAAFLVWPKNRPGPLALNAALSDLKRGPTAHNVLHNSDVARNFKAALAARFYCDMKVKLTTVGMPA